MSFQPSPTVPQTIQLPTTFPQGDYTPHGYLDNPAHSAVFNPSGVIRSVPPLGFGFWARAVTYGIGLERRVGYLSLLHLSVNIGGASFHTAVDFKAHGVSLVSRYHTRTLMSYDWEYGGMALTARYFLANEHILVCVLELDNRTTAEQTVTVHATNVYGFPNHIYWGRDGVTSTYRAADDVGVSKIWAYGDICIVGADRQSAAYKVTASRAQWDAWMAGNDLSSNSGAVVRFNEGADHLYTVMSYQVPVAAGASEHLVIGLARGVNEPVTLQTFFRATRGALAEAQRQLAADAAFYASAPQLMGDWPEAWKHGWIYDLETLRMTIRPPMGIFRHPWDGMQIHAPRSVLGEASLDSLCLSYADAELAKEVLYGTFANAPAPNVPCTREDGSMNMMGESASECGTAPNWCFPFFAIQSIYRRDRDDHWLRRLYPYLKAYLEWWLVNRTDAAGWFHADNSWEAGQDGSKRFFADAEAASFGFTQSSSPGEETPEPTGSGTWWPSISPETLQTSAETAQQLGVNPGAWTPFVRTVDIEAAVAQAMQSMVAYAMIVGSENDMAYWQQLAAERLERVRSMYVDGWFRDFDAHTDRPILLPNYFDINMLAPVALGLATKDQIEGLISKLFYFHEHPRQWLEWPPQVFLFAEAAWNAGLRDLAAQVLVDTGNRIYQRMDGRDVQWNGGHVGTELPEPYRYRVPGVSNEYWPLTAGEGVYPGCENYGWGGTLPTLIIRHLVGFREGPELEQDEFILAPTLPSSLFRPGQTYGLSNLRYRHARADVLYEIKDEGKIMVRLKSRLASARRITVKDEAGQVVAQTSGSVKAVELSFEAVNGALYTVALEQEW